MKTLILTVVLVLVPAYAKAQCTKDTDCKGDRICTKGECQNPSPSGCTKDTDCPGEKICSNQACVNTKKATSKSPERKIQAQRRVLFKTDANHKRGIEWVGGKMRLTNKGIEFDTHGLNLQRVDFSIKYREIKKVKKFGIIPNGIKVYLKDGEKHEFRVSNRGKVMSVIKEHIN